jgi:CheY-like chemotaxis protein
MPKTILVVEDFEDTQKLMKFFLEKLGYEVLQARDGWKAVESVKRQIPDLILMDMALPSVDGIQATKLIRQFEGAAEIPIIAFTASGQFISQQAMDAGCDALIDKPIDIDKLELIIKQYLET